MKLFTLSVVVIICSVGVPERVFKLLEQIFAVSKLLDIYIIMTICDLHELYFDFNTPEFFKKDCFYGTHAQKRSILV